MLKDRLFYCLQADGFALESRRLTPNNPDSLEVGYRFQKEGVEFVCRVDELDPATVILVYYGLVCLESRNGCVIKSKQAAPQKGPEKRHLRGLKTGFTELMWLLNYLKAKGFERIKGYVWADPKLYPDTASMQRMKLFYDRMGARLEHEQGQPFVVYTLKNYNRFRDLLPR